MTSKKFILILFLSVATMLQAQSTSGLIYNFKFDGNLTDSLSTTGFVQTATPNSVTYVADRLSKPNSALSVVKRTTATLPLLPQNNKARSISVWFYFNSINSNEQHIFSYGTYTTNQAFGFSAQPQAGTVRLYGWANDIQVSYSFTTGSWYNLIVTYDGAYATAYINGVRIINQVMSSWNTNGQTFNLAESPDGSTSYNISYDDLRIYDRVLNYQEVVAISDFNIDVNALKQSLISYYSFDSGFANQNNDLVLTEHNTVAKAAGKKGNCAIFTGNNGLYSNAYNTIFNESAGAKPFTVSFWKLDQNIGTYSSMFEFFSSYFLRFKSNGKVEIGYQGANSSSWYYTTSGSNLLNSSEWVHYTVVHDPAVGTDRVYINGLSSIYFNNSHTAINQNNSVFAIGCGTNADGSFHPDKFYMGKLDEFYLFDKALDPKEISYLYNNTDFITTAVHNPSGNSSAYAYTNATNDQLMFNVDEKVKKEIWSIQGSKVSETQAVSLNIGNLQKGVYLVRFISDNALIGTAKFIKQ